MKIKLIDKYGFSKVIDVEQKVKTIVIDVEQKVKTIHFASIVYGFIDFELSDIPKRGLPILKQVSDL